MTDTKSPELTRAEATAVQLLEGTERAWICGTGLLRTAEAEPPTGAELGRMIARTVELGFFPNGRAAYDDLGAMRDDAEVGDDIPTYTAVSRDGTSRMFVSLVGADTVLFAQSFEVEDGRQGFLLADVETVFTDLFNLLYVRGTQIDFTGVYEMSVSLVDRTPDRDAQLWTLDETRGVPITSSVQVSDVGDIVARTQTGLPLEEYLDVVREVGTHVARTFGAESSQWIPQEDNSEVQEELLARRRRLKAEG